MLTSRKSTNFLLPVEEFELIQQRNYQIIFQKNSETKISSNQCKKINGYMNQRTLSPVSLIIVEVCIGLGTWKFFSMSSGVFGYPQAS